jgi:hypothetical protein
MRAATMAKTYRYVFAMVAALLFYYESKAPLRVKNGQKQAASPSCVRYTE